MRDGLRIAEAQWLTHGRCRASRVGSSRHGTWVDTGALDHFDRTGRFIARAYCCEEGCTSWGVGPRIEPGPVTRDLCAEAGTRLVARGGA